MVKLLKLISLNKIQKRAFIYIFSISILSLLSLIQANLLYRDDIYRILSGYTLWEKDARPLASVATIIIQAGLPLTDISPLSQIIAVALYSLSAIYLGKIFKVQSLTFLSLGGIIFVLNPYNLQNFSYIFDSLTMGLSILSSSIAFLVVSQYFENSLLNNFKIPIICLAIGLLVSSLCLYQPSTSIYIGALVFYALVDLIENLDVQKSFKKFIFSISIFLISLLAYLPIQNYYIWVQASNQSHKYKLQDTNSTSLIDRLIDNFSFSLQHITDSLGNSLPRLSIIHSNPLLSITHSHPLLLILIVSFLFILTIIYKLTKNFYYKEHTQISFLKIFLIIISIVFYSFLIISSIYGLGLFLSRKIYEPRVFMGFSGVVAISCFSLAYFFNPSKFLKYFLIFVLSLLCLSFVNISLTFGNVLHYQNTQEQMIATILLSDVEEEIAKLSTSLKKPKLMIAGTLEPSALTKQAFRRYPILKKINPSYFKQNNIVGFLILKRSGLNFDFERLPKDNQFNPTSKPIVKRRIYNLYFENNNTFIVQFK